MRSAVLCDSENVKFFPVNVDSKYIRTAACMGIAVVSGLIVFLLKDYEMKGKRDG